MINFRNDSNFCKRSKIKNCPSQQILQNLGKVDRTADDIFDEHLQNFTKQQNAASKLQKEFNNYIRCVRAVQAASKSLMDSLNEMYESGWLGHELLYTQSQNIEMLWNDFSHKLADQVLIPLNTYQAQFPEMRKKIEKRGRKLVDYDSQRHNAQALQASYNNSKKKDEVKMAKVREQLEEAKRTYEVLNSELHDELPALHDSRVLFLVTNLQTYFAAEQVFHCETSKVFAELEAIVDRLATDSQRSSYSMKRLHSPKTILNHNAVLTSPSSSHTSMNDEPSSVDISSAAAGEESTSSVAKTNGESTSRRESPVNGDADADEKDIQPKHTKPQDDADGEDGGSANDANVATNGTATSVNSSTAAVATAESSNVSSSNILLRNINSFGNSDSLRTNLSNDNTASSSISVYSTNMTSSSSLNGVGVGYERNNKSQVEELYDIPAGATTDNLPPGVLYKVKATYKYTQEDVDELSFDVGEIIRVVEYDDPDEQEEGWLMGIKEVTGEKGMFPANFTRPL